MNNVLVIPTLEEIAARIVGEATKFVGVREFGYNKGPEVELFQKFTDGRASGEAWCMAFVQYITGQVCKHYGLKAKSVLYASENCQKVYEMCLRKYRTDAPGKGFIFIQQQRKVKWRGHTGFCKGKSTAGIFPSIEGNTNKAGSTEGDGVYEKHRYTAGNLVCTMRGFIDLPLMIQDAIKAQVA